ncbi:MAG: NAD(P)-dependent oxidoreductase [Dokdonella sp.]
MMTAAIIGIHSMLGRALATELRSRGVGIVGVGRGVGHDVAMDLTEPFAPNKVTPAPLNVTFHCAASFADDSPEGTRNNIATNTLGIATVLEFMRAFDCRRCIYAGTISSFKDADPNGLSSYGLSKLMGEQILHWGLERDGGMFCSLRLPQLYDTDGLSCVHQPWFGRIIAYASRGQSLHLPPSRSERNFLHVEDAARLMIRAADDGLTGTWPLCHPERLTTTQIAELAYREFDCGGGIIIDESKVPFRPIHFPESEGLFERLRDRPQITMAHGIALIRRSGQAANFGPLDVQ